MKWRDIALVVAGLALPILPYAALYLVIYGLHPTAYMINSGSIGLTLHNPVWRAYVLLIEPRQWFFAGEGVLERIPWLLFGFAGALWAWRRGAALALLSVCLIAYCLFFLCYVDLLPTGLWRYFNIHYFKWTLPGFGLLGWRLLGELRLGGRTAWAALAVVFLLSCIRVTPRPAGAEEAANVVDMPGPAATEGNTTMNPELAIARCVGDDPQHHRDAGLPATVGRRGAADRVEAGFHRRSRMDYRARRMGAGHAGGRGFLQRRWAEQIGFGYPCWLPLHARRCRSRRS